MYNNVSWSWGLVDLIQLFAISTARKPGFYLSRKHKHAQLTDVAPWSLVPIVRRKDANQQQFLIDSEDGFRTGCRNVSHPKQCFSGLQSPIDLFHASYVTPGFKSFS